MSKKKKQLCIKCIEDWPVEKINPKNCLGECWWKSIKPKTVPSPVYSIISTCECDLDYFKEENEKGIVIGKVISREIQYFIECNVQCERCNSAFILSVKSCKNKPLLYLLWDFLLLRDGCRYPFNSVLLLYFANNEKKLWQYHDKFNVCEYYDFRLYNSAKIEIPITEPKAAINNKEAPNHNK